MKTFIKRGLRYIFKGPEVIYQKPVIEVKISFSEPNCRLVGKKILITGGSRGIGYAIAKKSIDEGAKVIIVGRDELALKKASEELGCRYICSDIQKHENLQFIITRAEEILNGINCLVNNAGVSLHEGDIRHVSEQQYDIQFNTNLKSAYFLSQSFIQLVEQHDRKGCNILFISSERGTFVDDLPYGLTKNAINCLVKGLARRVISRDIRVNAVAPGITATQLTGIDADNLYIESNPSKRAYLPEEIAEISCFLLSDLSNCLSGQILTCDECRSINAYWK